MDLVSTFIKNSSSAQAVNHLPQIISRIGHPRPEDAQLIDLLIDKIFADYRDATLWKLGPVVLSANELRKQRAQTMLRKFGVRDKSLNIKVIRNDLKPY